MLIMILVMAMMMMRKVLIRLKFVIELGLGKEAPISKQWLFGVGSSDSSHFVEFYS